MRTIRERAKRRSPTSERDVPVAVYVPQAQIADVIAAGISRASFGADRAGAMLELIGDLLLSLEDPSRDAAWERREDAFAEARDRELEALVAQSLIGAERGGPLRDHSDAAKARELYSSHREGSLQE